MIRIPPGTVLQLAAGEWEYGDGPVRIEIRQVLDHLSRYYDGRKVWLDGVRLDDRGAPAGAVQVLVVVSALRAFEQP